MCVVCGWVVNGLIVFHIASRRCGFGLKWNRKMARDSRQIQWEGLGRFINLLQNLSGGENESVDDLYSEGRFFSYINHLPVAFVNND